MLYYGPILNHGDANHNPRLYKIKNDEDMMKYHQKQQTYEDDIHGSWTIYETN